MKVKSMTVLSSAHRSKLIANGKANPHSPHRQINNVPPVCWIYDEFSKAAWLLTEIDRTNPNRAWGLVDAGNGLPDYEAVDLKQLEDCQKTVTFSGGGCFNIGAQALQGWTAKGPISAYIAAAATAGRIVELGPVPTSSRNW
jgi:hypothetical protein